MSEPLSRPLAVRFFADFFHGEHHIPGARPYVGADNVKAYGSGWSVVDPGASYATYDFDQLTRLVFLAHDRSVRVQIQAKGRGLEIAIWGRAREGGMALRHPDLDSAMAEWRRAHANPSDAVVAK